MRRYWVARVVFLALLASLASLASAEDERPRLVAQLGHGSAVLDAAFSPDGRFVVTGGRDDAAVLWDAATGQEIRRFEA